eukprot:4760306-Prymnesium_polylepis.1
MRVRLEGERANCTLCAASEDAAARRTVSFELDMAPAGGDDGDVGYLPTDLTQCDDRMPEYLREEITCACARVPPTLCATAADCCSRVASSALAITCKRAHPAQSKRTSRRPSSRSCWLASRRQRAATRKKTRGSRSVPTPRSRVVRSLLCLRSRENARVIAQGECVVCHRPRLATRRGSLAFRCGCACVRWGSLARAGDDMKGGA